MNKDICFYICIWCLIVTAILITGVLFMFAILYLFNELSDCEIHLFQYKETFCT